MGAKGVKPSIFWYKVDGSKRLVPMNAWVPIYFLEMNMRKDPRDLTLIVSMQETMIYPRKRALNLLLLVNKISTRVYNHQKHIKLIACPHKLVWANNEHELHLVAILELKMAMSVGAVRWLPTS